jgi:hypothetical protein
MLSVTDNSELPADLFGICLDDTLLQSRPFVNCMPLRFRVHGHDLCFMNRMAGYVQQIETNDPI